MSLELCGIVLKFAPSSIVFYLEMKPEVEVGVNDLGRGSPLSFNQHATRLTLSSKLLDGMSFLLFWRTFYLNHSYFCFFEINILLIFNLFLVPWNLKTN